MASSRSLPESTYDAASESGSIASRAASPLGASVPEGAVYTTHSNVVVKTATFVTQPSIQISYAPILPGAFASQESLSLDMSGANAAFMETYFDEASDVPALLEAGRPNFEQPYLTSGTE